MDSLFLNELMILNMIKMSDFPRKFELKYNDKACFSNYLSLLNSLIHRNTWKIYLISMHFSINKLSFVM